MDNYSNKSFYSDEEWQSLSTPVVKKEYTEPASEEFIEPKAKKPKKPSKHPVLTVQLTLSLCVLLFVFVLKILSAPFYDKVLTWYENEISNSITYNFDFESVDFSSVFATPDEV